MTETSPAPSETTPFESLYTNPVILKNLLGMGFTTPTPIQVQAAPFVLQGRDLFAGAKTGSGKTIGFLAPLAERIFKDEIKVALVLCPTRELALQSDEEAMKLLDGQTKVVSIPLYGGVPVDPQVLAMKHHKPRILIATPGRVLDLISEPSFPVSQIESIVLDEADRMCDMGFAPQVGQILDLCTSRKQMLFFSATLPKELNEIMSRFANDPARIQVDAADKSSETIHHRAIICSRREKIDKVLELLGSEEMSSVIFTRTRNQADEIYRSLKEYIPTIGILHAGYEMDEREKTIRKFREGRLKHIVATDVVSRGIDIDTMTHVIHFELPDQLEDYIHRSGRVGRAGRTGTSIAIIDERDHDSVQMLKSLMNKIKIEIIGTLPEERSADQHSRRGGHGDHRTGERTKGRGGHRAEHSRQEGHRSHSNRGPSRSHGTHSRSEHSHSKRSEGHRSPRTEKHSTAKKTHTKHAKPKGLLAKTKSFLSRIFKG